MSIKKTLKSLVNAVLTAWRGSHKSVIKGTYIASDVTLTTLGVPGSLTFIAPSDGILVIQCRAPCDAICLRQGSSLDWGRFLAESAFIWPVGFIPLKKGTVCSYYVDGPSTTIPATAHLRFYPYVGS